jgi:hypothetical protein
MDKVLDQLGCFFVVAPHFQRFLMGPDDFSDFLFGLKPKLFQSLLARFYLSQSIE